MKKQATIVGAGLVGSLWAIYLNRAGFDVKVFERRPDMRKAKIGAGKSINLATSYRGWKALDTLGIGDEIREIAIPMYGRTLHGQNEENFYQPYGINQQAIYSVSRGAINAKLMDIAERDAQFFFNEECTNVDLKNNTCTFKNSQTSAVSEIKSDLIFATDGAFSAVRYNAMQKLDRFSYSQNYIPDGYKEILLPANGDGSFKLDKNTLHIWPRAEFMLIALPNFDGSFTCTLFMPFEGHQHCFNNLTSKEKIQDFFINVFPDFYKMMPDVANHWDEHPLSSLAIVRCFPWYHNNTVLMGDAAHATVPFFGQGMNCGFEDCTVMWELMQKHGATPEADIKVFEKVFAEYQKMRKPNGDAVQDLSILNYVVMRDKVNDTAFQLQQKIERRINEMYPEKYFPMYSMVSFSDIEYHVALSKGKEQDEMMSKFIADHQITIHTSAIDIDKAIHTTFGDKLILN